jgi:hypothetical protein
MLREAHRFLCRGFVYARKLEMILPGLTTATQYSGEPLPLPILVSAGFFVTGLSGKILIQTFPPLLIYLVIATRAAQSGWI